MLMVQACCGLHLHLEPSHLARVQRCGGREDLHGHTATSERELASFVDDPHTATAEFADEFEITEHLQTVLGIAGMS